MKKTLVILFAAALVVAFTLPASAFDSEFGGLWRTRWYVQTDFTGDDSGAQNVQVIDTRTRLYYTAVFSDNFRFVNRFEFNVGWGDNRSATAGGVPGVALSGGGGIGTDGRGIFRIKNSYADFRLGATRWTVGLQGAVLARGFLFDDDFAGLIARYQPGTTGDILVPLMYASISDSDANGTNGDTAGPNDDVSLWALYPFFSVGNMNFNPYLVYRHQNFSGTTDASGDTWWLGLDWDMKFSAWSLWLSGIYNGGEQDGGTNSAAGAKADLGGYLLGLGFNVPFGGFGIHGEGWYASGDNDAADDKNEAFQLPEGASYYWSEIMGFGIFDNQASKNAPANKISNVYAVNLGLDWKPSDLWALKADLWYASLVEDTALSAGEKDLGTELDVVLTYKLLENMNLDIVGAYLFAGKATTANAAEEKNPYELGLRMQFTF